MSLCVRQAALAVHMAEALIAQSSDPRLKQALRNKPIDRQTVSGVN
jgi:hypothetical protein